jgi:hypothetical protein
LTKNRRKKFIKKYMEPINNRPFTEDELMTRSDYVRLELTPKSDNITYLAACTDAAGKLVHSGYITAKELFLVLDSEQFACFCAGQRMFFISLAKIKSRIK